MNKKIIIALDGYSATGKSTMAKALAKSLSYNYIDSGAMYRAVTLYALEHNLIQNGEIDTEALANAMDDIEINFTRNELGEPITLLNGQNVEDKIRTPEVNAMVSPISTLGFVRQELTKKQQAYGEEKGIVMDGRDIGTTVFPQAELKLFVTATPQVRAERRYREMLEKGITNVSLEEVLANLAERDRIDSTRAISPLAKAPDAITFDNSFLTPAEQDAQLLRLAKQVIATQ